MLLFLVVSLYSIILSFSDFLNINELFNIYNHVVPFLTKFKTIDVDFFFKLLSYKILFVSVGVLIIYIYERTRVRRDACEKMYKHFCKMIPDGVIVFSRDKVIFANDLGNEIIRKKMLSDKKNLLKDNACIKELVERALNSTESIKSTSYKITNKKNMDYFFDVETLNSFLGNKKIGFIILKERKDRNTVHLIEKYLNDLGSERNNFEILNRISHELRTPINILQGVLYNSINTVEEINDNHLKSRLLKDFSIYDRNIHRMLKLSNSFIRLIEMQTSQNFMCYQNCDVVNIIKNLVETSKEYAKVNNNKIEFYSEIKNKYCAVDVDKFEKIILSLLSNAVKFSKPKSKILIRTSEKDRELKIDVCNVGKQIDKAQQEIIFKLFQQGEQLFTRSTEGLGLGLHFVKRYTELHGGRATVTSNNEGNTKFSITLPICFYDNLQQVDLIVEAERCKQKAKIEFSDLLA